MAQTLVYVATPISPNGTGRSVAENIKQASDIARELWAEGYSVICPALNTAFVGDKLRPFDAKDFNSGIAPERFYEGDLEMVKRCDAVVLSPDWQHSVGATKEKVFAEDLHIPVYVYPDRPPVTHNGAYIRTMPSA